MTPTDEIFAAQLAASLRDHPWASPHQFLIFLYDFVPVPILSDDEWVSPDGWPSYIDRAILVTADFLCIENLWHCQISFIFCRRLLVLHTGQVDVGGTTPVGGLSTAVDGGRSGEGGTSRLAPRPSASGHLGLISGLGLALALALLPCLDRCIVFSVGRITEGQVA